MSPLARRWRAARARVLAAEGRLPLRVRLLVIVVLLLLTAMTVTSLVSLQLLQNNLRDQVDEQLTQTGKVAINQAFPALNQSATQNLFLSEYWVQFADADGGNSRDVCARARPGGSCTDAPDLSPLTTSFVATHQGQAFTVPDADGGDPWRVLVFPAEITGTGTPINIAVALPLSGASRTLSDFRTVALGVSVAVLVLGGFSAALAIRRSFRPLDDIERTASAIAAGDLSQRVPHAPPGTEIGRLSTALNTMLTQIEALFRSQQRSEEQMRRFVADASHELRTPLAAIRGFAELYRQGAVREPDDVAHVMGRIEGESTRLGRLVEDLLALARLDEAQRRRAVTREPVDLAVVASDAVHDARALAPDRAVRLVGVEDGVGPGSAPGAGRRVRDAPGPDEPAGQRRPPHPARDPRGGRGGAAGGTVGTGVGGGGARPRSGVEPGAGGPGLRALLPGGLLAPARDGRRVRSGAGHRRHPRRGARRDGRRRAHPGRRGHLPGALPRRGRARRTSDARDDRGRDRARPADSQLGSRHLRVALQAGARYWVV